MTHASPTRTKTGAACAAIRAQAPFCLATAVIVLLAHAIAYLTHEYAHAITAWLLGWKRDPLALNYGRATLANILFQQDIDENVDYAPVFASGHTWDAALIAFAGPGIGNGLAYIVYAAAVRRTLRRPVPCVAIPLFWLAMMSAGNVWSYAPTRALATHADMALMARGLGLSVWTQFPLVTIPSLVLTWHFFARCVPKTVGTLWQDRPERVIVVAATVAFFYFGFFGGGMVDGGYGDPAALFSIVSILILLPLAVLYVATSGTMPFGNDEFDQISEKDASRSERAVPVA